MRSLAGLACVIGLHPDSLSWNLRLTACGGPCSRSKHESLALLAKEPR